jgi:glycosyltransferase involved in cell wall biosynthesis
MNEIELSVVAPVYNESEGIEQVVRYWNQVLERPDLSSEIVLANDGSTDQTLEILERLKTEIPRLRVVSYSPNRGYGYALKTAIAASRGEIVVSLDSDGQFDLADFPKLLGLYRSKGLDFVTGYRDRKKDSLLRVFADRSLNLIVRTLFRLDLRDTNCALKLMKGDMIRSLNLEATGYPTPTEITVKLVKLGARSGETAVVHRERVAGQSKLKFMKTSISMFRFLLYLRKRVKLYESRIIQTL